MTIEASENAEYPAVPSVSFINDQEQTPQVPLACMDDCCRMADGCVWDCGGRYYVPGDAVGAKNRALMIATAADLIERGVIACVERGNEPTEWIECLTCSAAVPRGSLDKHELWHEAMQEVRDAVWRSGGLDG